MPVLKVTANFEVEEAKTVELMKELAASIASVMEKPVEYYMTGWEKQTIVLGLTTDPAVFVAFHSMSKINPELNKQYSALICSFFEEKLNVSKARIFINFVGVKGANWGYNGGTFIHLD
eukprot:TRINITY_DN229_c0_g2_i1.p2 TRINITY_DN229_c0_g2~~TRINITY_DN229_c0_g2_i1.p2  ORF type:complete len:119 (-),score=53.12 TRINITY_DN229_c0_g2_i1:44-400(-)